MVVGLGMPSFGGEREGGEILFTLEEEEVIPELRVLRRPRAMAVDESMDHNYETAIVSPTIDL